MTRIRRILTALATLAGALLAFTAASPPRSPSACRHRAETDGRAGPGQDTTPPHPVHTIVAGGMPGWQIALIAAAAALAAAAVAVLLDRAWAARKAHATTA